VVSCEADPKQLPTHVDFEQEAACRSELVEDRVLRINSLDVTLRINANGVRNL
jgi:hypothetical protein